MKITEQTNFIQTLVFTLALAFAIFQIITAAFSPLPSIVVRAMHVGFVIALIYLSAASKASNLKRTILLILAVGGLISGLYEWVYESDLISRAGELNHSDWLIGSVALILVFDCARRVLGWALPSICLIFILYALAGPYLPEPLEHRGYDIEQIISQLSFGTEGIYGTPTYVSSSYIFLFILFGAFLEQAGMLTLFNNLALGLVGKTQGGPAKVAVVSSALMGTISGSGIANVVSTGQLTIPLMKRFGYKSHFAGAVEATSSMGGQIMPPVMGAVAFIMAETLNMPYSQIAKAAIIPALLYFFTILSMVHFEAKRLNLKRMNEDDCPNPWQTFKKQFYLLFPLIILVGTLFGGFTPLFAGMIGLLCTVLLILGQSTSQVFSRLALRIGFWVLLAMACSTFLSFGISALFIVITVLSLILAIQSKYLVLKSLLDALNKGAMQAVGVGISCALVGVIIGITSLTGAATSIAEGIVTIGEHSLLLSLLLTMLTCLVLGMGIPTIPNYIITSSIAAPALLDLGVPLLVSHLFVFYFGIMADLTPPVALAAFAASPIAKAPPLKIGVKSLQLAMAGFVVPFMAVYSPILFLQGDFDLSIFLVALVKAIIAVSLWATGSIGFAFSPLTLWQRALFIVTSAMLISTISWLNWLALLVSSLIAVQLFLTNRFMRAT